MRGRHRVWTGNSVAVERMRGTQAGLQAAASEPGLEGIEGQTHYLGENWDHIDREGSVISLECPVCGVREVGKIGNQHYYCWNCWVEFRISCRGVEVFRVDPEGVLTSMSVEEQKAYLALRGSDSNC